MGKYLTFCGSNITSTIMFFFKPVHSMVSLSDLVLCKTLILVSISTYVDNVIKKVPISSKIGIRVQLSTSKI